jgi:hypothetical protein
LKRREDWFDGQLDLAPERLVFIDETWASTNMARKRGRCPKGERLRMGVPHGHWTRRAAQSDFNRIEMAFSKLKALLRKAAERTIPALWDAIDRLIDLVTPAKATNYFAAAGYVS